MRVQLAYQDQQLMRRVAIAVDSLATALEARQEFDICVLALAPGVLAARFIAKDGVSADVAVGVAPLAMAIASGKVDAYTRFMVKKALQQAALARVERRTGLVLLN